MGRSATLSQAPPACSSDADPCDDGAPQAVSEQDSNRGADFHSTQVQSVVFDDIQLSVTIAGLGNNSDTWSRSCLSRSTAPRCPADYSAS
jgi:hypothetical protein